VKNTGEDGKEKPNQQKDEVCYALLGWQENIVHNAHRNLRFPAHSAKQLLNYNPRPTLSSKKTLVPIKSKLL
jgi:hypothetical protein